MGLLSAFALMRPIIFAWCGQCVPGPCGALRWAEGVRDFSGLDALVPGDKNYRRGPGFVICASARAGGFLTCTDAGESA